MGRRKLLAGNWKMNKSLSELPDFFSTLIKECGSLPQLLEKADLFFSVPFTLLDGCQRFAKMHGFQIAAQNAHWEASGAFTGEISLGHLKELGILSTLVGHSERRQYFGETDDTVEKKVRACLTSNVLPVACVGESRAEREVNQTEAVVTRQMQAVIKAKIGQQGRVIIAYEPVWAIGTGLSATAEQADEVHQLIRSLWEKAFGNMAADDLTILYGGSANAANAKSLFSKKNIDGALVGGASLKPIEFAQMLRALAV